MKTICLNMIVRNEAAVIRRSLASVKCLIDHWVIVDTGSTDGTQEIIRSFLSEIPGALYERPWVNFAVNRNQALQLAQNRADYILFIDADEEFTYETPRFDKRDLTKDFYYVATKVLRTLVHRILLIRDHPGWYWRDVIHEFLYNTHPMEGELLCGVTNDANGRDGARTRDPQKFYRDIAVLEQAIQDEPDNPRYLYFLAQSYGCVENFPAALHLFERRAQERRGEPEEIYWALYSMGCLQQDLKKKPDEVIDSFTRAYLVDPTRAEALYRLAVYFIDLRAPLLSYLIASFAKSFSPPKKAARVGFPIYAYRLHLLLADAAHLIGHDEEAYALYRALLANPSLSEEDRANIQNNVTVYQRLFR